ncbi:cbb3-type cytochrome c oxidase subunit I [Alkalibacillus aidingensis]|uniref:cbb3-type cytochrome c oxidase subunit I n=1 Tax=Alkalibacillus aidingensis TaxID=2747607 RepID=UPI0016606F42|nr:cbb3-type cytochrome c oxidase subunit I [Alkalibacillus aidingensis]
MDNPLVKINPMTKRLVTFPVLMSGLFIFLMMAFGVIMLLNQANMIQINMGMFYQLMTIHGTGMIGFAALGAAGIMWYFLSQYVELNRRVFQINLILFLLGVVSVLVGIFKYDFAGGWTFLYPLPAMSGGMWAEAGATLYLGGMLLIGCGFLLLFLEVSRAIISKYGSFAQSLGWPHIFGLRKEEDAPPPTVVASTMVSIVNITALIAGAAILVMSLINLYNPSFTIDPLLAKNLIYAFGHIFANSIIYMGVILVYEMLPRYTGRPWKSYKIFLIAWTLSTIFTIIIYPHHLLMDFVMPNWMLIIGQVLSYMNGLPVLIVTAYGALMIVYRSGIKWDVTSSFIMLSMFGWVIGVIPAIIDATIIVNQVMHNTQWVPGHFHLYMGIGATAMIIGFMFYLTKFDANRTDQEIDRASFWSFIIGILGLSASFLYSGQISTPRRWAEHVPEWIAPNIIGVIFGTIATLAMLVFVFRFIVISHKIGKSETSFDESTRKIS